jgi:hypothetical protein
MNIEGAPFLFGYKCSNLIHEDKIGTHKTTHSNIVFNKTTLYVCITGST